MTKKRQEEEDRRRKTHDAGNMLPEIKGQNQQSSKNDKRKNAANADQSTLPPAAHKGVATESQQPPLHSKDTAGKKTRKPNNKSVRVRSDLRQDDSQGENYDEAPVKAVNATHTANEEDRKSVASKGSAVNQS